MATLSVLRTSNISTWEPRAFVAPAGTVMAVALISQPGGGAFGALGAGGGAMGAGGGEAGGGQRTSKPMRPTKPRVAGVAEALKAVDTPTPMLTVRGPVDTSGLPGTSGVAELLGVDVRLIRAPPEATSWREKMVAGGTTMSPLGKETVVVPTAEGTEAARVQPLATSPLREPSGYSVAKEAFCGGRRRGEARGGGHGGS